MRDEKETGSKGRWYKPRFSIQRVVWAMKISQMIEVLLNLTPLAVSFKADIIFSRESLENRYTQEVR